MKSPACRAVHVNRNFDFYALFSCHYHSSSIAFICIPSLHSIALKSIAYMRGPHPHGVDFKKLFGHVRCWSSSSLYMFSPHHFYLFHHPFRSTLFSLCLRSANPAAHQLHEVRIGSSEQGAATQQIWKTCQYGLDIYHHTSLAVTAPPGFPTDVPIGIILIPVS